MIERFTRELEAVGGHVHHGRDALAGLEGEGVSVTPCLALIAETGTAVVSARLSGGRRAGLETILVLSGVTSPGEAERYSYRPSRIVDSVADLIDGLEGAHASA